MVDNLELDRLYQEIDVADLLDRILKRRIEAKENGMCEMVLVIQSEEYKAITYYAVSPDKRQLVRVPLLRSIHIEDMHPFLSQMKHAPTTGLVVMGMPTIGSDNVGELSPWIL